MSEPGLSGIGLLPSDLSLWSPGQTLTDLARLTRYQLVLSYSPLSALYHVCRLFIQSFVFKMVLYRCRGKRTHYVLRLDIPRLRFNMESSQQIRI